jgi:hypothetical protein
LAFAAFGLPRPRVGAWQRTLDGELGDGGLSGRLRPPCRETHQIGRFDVTLPELPKRERAITPKCFRDALLDLARSAVTQAGPQV